MLVIGPGCKTGLTCLRSDGTVWEYAIGKLRGLNMKIYKRDNDSKARRDKLASAQALVTCRKACTEASRFVRPMPADYVPPREPELSRYSRRLQAKRSGRRWT